MRLVIYELVYYLIPVILCLVLYVKIGKVLFKMKDRLFSDFPTTKIFETKSSLKFLTTLIENKTLFHNTKLTSVRKVFCLNKTFLTFRL